MKKFLVNYRYALGSFLDEENIQWEQVNDNQIYIYCKDENELFTIACKYENFALSLEEKES